LIKLDIINEVVNRTGITKTKAEMAVETVFESMKKALERLASAGIRGRARRFRFRPERLCVLSPAKNCRRCSNARPGKKWRVRARKNERRVPPGSGG
jgi:SOS-response transcriptional repressor LexA